MVVVFSPVYWLTIVVVVGGTSYELSMSFMVNCGVDGFCMACTLMGAVDNTSRLDSAKKAKDKAINLLILFIINKVWCVFSFSSKLE